MQIYGMGDIIEQFIKKLEGSFYHQPVPLADQFNEH